MCPLCVPPSPSSPPSPPSLLFTSPFPPRSADAIDFVKHLVCDASGRLGNAGGLGEVRTHPWLGSIEWSTLHDTVGAYTEPAMAQRLQAALDELKDMKGVAALGLAGAELDAANGRQSDLIKELTSNFGEPEATPRAARYVQ